MFNRQARLLVLAPVAAGALIAAPLAFAPVALAPRAAAALPAATCSVSAASEDGTARLSGSGFEPGLAFLSSPTAPGGSFMIGSDGGFQMMNVKYAPYTVQQGGERTVCGGFGG
ncbi:hypothetical protein [Streptomyces sp. NPDC090022]|uniref:hypothetical protein n=1 Tax=Streptomyces sp. NPDC090022 TaxID=3365920 RepID=UPI0038238666